MSPTAEPSATSGSTKRSEGAPPADPDQPPEHKDANGRSCTDRSEAALTPEVQTLWEASIPCCVDLATFNELLTRAIDMVGAEMRSVAVAIIDDPAMSALHEEHCGDASTTDVLTFESQHAEGGVGVDIAICFDEAKRQASERGHTVEEELLLYAVHGVLHCAGFQDKDSEAFQKMHAEEDRILTALGIGPVFDSSTSRADRQEDAS